MDAMDILGELLGGGRAKSGGSLGGKILKDLVGGGRTPEPSAQSRTSGFDAPGGRSLSIDEQARQLEDLLGVAKHRQANQGSRGGAIRPEIPAAAPRNQLPSSPGSGRGFSFDERPPVVDRQQPLDQNEEAVVLIRAMINAAKSDGRITRVEQDAIVGRISNPSNDAIEFLRSEFSKPVDVREFAWSVPLGMEQKVYAMSLAAIDLDSKSEATYLRELAHGLRLEPTCCNRIHQQYGMQTLY